MNAGALQIIIRTCLANPEPQMPSNPGERVKMATMILQNEQNLELLHEILGFIPTRQQLIQQLQHVKLCIGCADQTCVRLKSALLDHFFVIAIHVFACLEKNNCTFNCCLRRQLCQIHQRKCAANPESCLVCVVCQPARDFLQSRKQKEVCVVDELPENRKRKTGESDDESANADEI